jgi:hypothetical protein
MTHCFPYDEPVQGKLQGFQSLIYSVNRLPGIAIRVKTSIAETGLAAQKVFIDQ